MADMSNMMPATPIDPKASSSSATNQPTATDATTAGAAATSNAPASYTNKTTIGSMAELKKKAPKVYKFMMLSMAQNICIQIKHDNDRIIQRWKEIRRQSGG